MGMILKCSKNVPKHPVDVDIKHVDVNFPNHLLIISYNL